MLSKKKFVRIMKSLELSRYDTLSQGWIPTAAMKIITAFRVIALQSIAREMDDTQCLIGSCKYNGDYRTLYDHLVSKGRCIHCCKVENCRYYQRYNPCGCYKFTGESTDR